jgi:RNA polymerase sigma-70 factor (ECF subfamily)
MLGNTLTASKIPAPMPPHRDLDSDTRRAAFEAAALPFMQALYSTAHRLTRGGDDASDLVQDTFLRAYRTFDNFSPGTNCRGWLLTIMYSVYINQYHKARRAPTMSIDELEGRFQRYLEARDNPGDAAATVPVRGASAELRVSPEVERAIEQLPEEFRAAVLFVDVEGLSYDEAAAVVGCPVGTIRSRLYRGRRMLFAALRDYAADMGFGRGDA